MSPTSPRTGQLTPVEPGQLIIAVAFILRSVLVCTVNYVVILVIDVTLELSPLCPGDTKVGGCGANWRKGGGTMEMSLEVCM